MNKTLIIAKMRRWQAELHEMVEVLKAEGKSGPILQILQKRADEIEGVISAIRDKSFIPKGDISFEPGAVMDEISEKVKKVKAGVRKLDELKKQKQKIISEMGED